MIPKEQFLKLDPKLHAVVDRRGRVYRIDSIKKTEGSWQKKVEISDIDNGFTWDDLVWHEGRIMQLGEAAVVNDLSDDKAEVVLITSLHEEYQRKFR